MTRLSDLVREQPFEPRREGEAAARKDGPQSTADKESAQRWYAGVRQEVRRLGEAVRSNTAPQLEACAGFAKQLVHKLHEDDEAVRWALRGETDDYLVDNALHVAIFGVKVGMGLHYSDEELERLALGGLLHDLGMWTLPPTLFEKAGSLTEDERVSLRAHPERGRRILAELGGTYEWLSTISAQEHERWNGSGYPCRLKGSQILEQAQIIGLADVFDALITPRPYKRPALPHQALRELLVHHKQDFQQRILKTLVDQISLYPVGTTVRLNTGDIGVVSKVNPKYPLRPVLAVNRPQKAGASKESDSVDLRMETTAHIVEVLASMNAA